MAITNPEAIRFSNEVLRPLADLMAKLYYKTKQAADEFTANNLISMFPNNSEVIEDGANVDGRTIITGADARAVITMLASIITDYEANTKLKLNQILKVSVNVD